MNDQSIERTWKVLCAGQDVDARAHIVGTPQLSRDGLERWAEGDAKVLAKHPSVDPAALERYLERHDTAATAATNPAAVPLLDPRTLRHIHRQHIARNPAATVELLLVAFETAPDRVLSHPNCPSGLRDDPQLREQHPRLWSNPALPRADVEAAIADHDNPSVVVRAIVNPNTGTDTLAAIAARSHPNVTGDVAINVAGRQLELRDWFAAPLERPRTHAWYRPLHPAIVAAIDALDPDAVAAATALASGGFRGDLNSLLSVATTFSTRR
jgi:hypothetical protein